MNKLIAIFAVLLMLGGCATTKVDPNYAAQIEAYSSVQRANADVAKAKADAEKARYDAIATIGQTGDSQAKVLAVFALAIGPNGQAAQTPPSSSSPPLPPESDADKAYKWTALFAGPLTNIASGYFGYKLGVTQSNNATSASIANTNAFASTASAGYTALGATSIAGFNSNGTIAGLIQAPAPNITLSGTGVIGAGTYSAPVTTHQCTGGQGAAGSSGTTGAGGSGPGGAANC
jgi:hypothetical protein